MASPAAAAAAPNPRITSAKIITSSAGHRGRRRCCCRVWRSAVTNPVQHGPQRTLHSQVRGGGIVITVAAAAATATATTTRTESGTAPQAPQPRRGPAVGHAGVHGVGGGGRPGGDAEAVQEAVEVGHVGAAAAGGRDRRQARAARLEGRGDGRDERRRPAVRRRRVRWRCGALVGWEHGVVGGRVGDLSEWTWSAWLCYSCTFEREHEDDSTSIVGGWLDGWVMGVYHACALTVRRGRRADRSRLEVLGAQPFEPGGRPDLDDSFGCCHGVYGRKYLGMPGACARLRMYVGSYVQGKVKVRFSRKRTGGRRTNYTTGIVNVRVWEESQRVAVAVVEAARTSELPSNKKLLAGSLLAGFMSFTNGQHG